MEDSMFQRGDSPVSRSGILRCKADPTNCSCWQSLSQTAQAAKGCTSGKYGDEQLISAAIKAFASGKLWWRERLISAGYQGVYFR